MDLSRLGGDHLAECDDKETMKWKEKTQFFAQKNSPHLLADGDPWIVRSGITVS
jgi:hypothetical protein